ncbi:protein C3orf33 homolog isoform X2 [Heptranchias perlo]|uniref:protein C3orf33 homolog isoform X2 n=1 Tax=Heptranchias perlo TaxID=212740 RepID=UPI003559956F
MSDEVGKVLGSYLSSVVDFGDEHIHVLRVTKFTCVTKIPDNFIAKSVKLRGRVHHVTENGLEVEHIPITLPVISSLQRKRQSNGHLMVRLAGLEMTDEARTWLREQIKPSHIIWFQLLRRENSFIDCIVRLNKGGFFTVCLNEEILREGLGRAVTIEGLHSNPKLYWRLQTRLLKAELKAQKKGKGLWKEPNFIERISNNLRNSKILHNLHNLILWVRSLRKK